MLLFQASVAQDYLSFNPGVTIPNFKTNDDNPHDYWEYNGNPTFGFTIQYHINDTNSVPTISLRYKRWCYEKDGYSSGHGGEFNYATITTIDFIILEFEQEFHFFQEPDFYLKLGVFFGKSINYSNIGTRISTIYSVSPPFSTTNTTEINDKNKSIINTGFLLGFGYIHPIGKSLGLRFNVDTNPSFYQDIRFEIQPSFGIVWKLNSSLANKF